MADVENALILSRNESSMQLSSPSGVFDQQSHMRIKKEKVVDWPFIYSAMIYELK